MKSSFVHTVRITIIVAIVTTLILFFNFFKENNFSFGTFQFIQSLDGIEEYQLKKNGLKILLMEDHSAPVVTTLVTYLVGQREEFHHPEEVAHLLEHMVMKSTENYNQAKGKTAANALQAIGAIMNATTEPDSTYYYETFPSEHLALALDIQADRMRNTLFLKEDVEREREVVRNELESLANSKLNLLVDAIWKTAYKKHPYRHSIIGYRERARKLSADDLKKFFDDYYWPNNAVLSVIGDFDKKTVFDLIEKKFSKIPKSLKPIPPFLVEEPKQIKPYLVRLETKESDERVILSFKSPSAIHEDGYALDVLGKILSGGRKSRMYQLFTDQKVCVGTEVSYSNTKDPGLFSIFMQLAPEVEHRQAVKWILKMLAEIKMRGVSDAELNRAKKQIKSQMAFARDGSFSIASYMSQAVGFGDWTIYPKYLERIEKVTADDILRAAQAYFTRENLTVGFLKSSQEKNRKPVKIKWADFYTQTPVILRAKPEESKILRQKAPQDDSLISKQAKIIPHPTSLKNVVFVYGSFEGAGRAFSPNYFLADMTAGMLDKGTKRMNKSQLAEQIENLGANISLFIDHKRFRFRIGALKEDVPEVLALFRELLLEPSFPKEEFETMKAQNAEAVKAKLTDPMQMAYGEFKRSLYPMNHPNFEPAPYDQLNQLQELAIEDIKKFYDDHYQFKNLKVVVSGDVDEQILNTVLQSLPPSRAEPIQTPYDGKARLMPSQEKKIFLEGKRSIEIFLGHTLFLRQNDQDYPSALLANFALGGNFSARLLTRVREEKGLTYSIHSQFVGMSNDTDGHWVTDLIAVPEFADQALKETKNEIALWVRDGISAEELARNKTTIAGNHKVSLATTEGATRQMLSAEEMELGIDYLKTFPEKINAVTLESANQAIKNYFKPNQISTAMAGEYKKE